MSLVPLRVRAAKPTLHPGLSIGICAEIIVWLGREAARTDEFAGIHAGFAD